MVRLFNSFHSTQVGQAGRQEDEGLWNVLLCVGWWFVGSQNVAKSSHHAQGKRRNVSTRPLHPSVLSPTRLSEQGREPLSCPNNPPPCHCPLCEHGAFRGEKQVFMSWPNFPLTSAWLHSRPIETCLHEETTKHRGSSSSSRRSRRERTTTDDETGKKVGRRHETH